MPNDQRTGAYQTRGDAENAVREAVANHDPAPSRDQAGFDAWSIRCPIPTHDAGSNNEYVAIGVWERKARRLRHNREVLGKLRITPDKGRTRTTAAAVQRQAKA